MPRKLLAIGIIGAGGIVRRHAVAYRCLPELARLVAVADVDKDRANAAKREHGFAEIYTDYRELLGRDNIDVVSICTPPHLHSRMVIEALDAGMETYWQLLAPGPDLVTVLTTDHTTPSEVRSSPREP